MQILKLYCWVNLSRIVSTKVSVQMYSLKEKLVVLLLEKVNTGQIVNIYLQYTNTFSNSIHILMARAQLVINFQYIFANEGISRIFALNFILFTQFIVNKQ